jgi:tRNA threonylcarbamoyladenosine biosynthesis protein TsaE
MTSIALSLKDLEASMAFGLHLGLIAAPGDVITLGGSLGAGKTTLTQAIGQGLEVPTDQYITSPTFSLLHEYLGRLPLYHMDLYRLSGEEEIEELGFEDYIYGNGLTVIEWPDRLGTLMPEDRLHIELTSCSENARKAQLTAHGDSWGERIIAMLKRKEWTPEKSTD